MQTTYFNSYNAKEILYFLSEKIVFLGILIIFDNFSLVSNCSGFWSLSLFLFTYFHFWVLSNFDEIKIFKTSQLSRFI